MVKDRALTLLLLEKERLEKERQEKDQKQTTNPNKIIHDKILQETADIALTIMDINICTLWWAVRWVEERQADLGKTDIQKLNSYKTWVWKNFKKTEVGMKHVKVTPNHIPAKNTGGAAAGSD
jgi:hypothetical protein